MGHLLVLNVEGNMMETKYCECCGIPVIEILSRLSQETFYPFGKRSWEAHTQYANQSATNTFHTSGFDYCNECGIELKDDDVHVSYEHREFWGSSCNESIVTGYSCSNCGYEENY